jgi:hypothetical protein
MSNGSDLFNRAADPRADGDADGGRPLTLVGFWQPQQDGTGRLFFDAERTKYVTFGEGDVAASGEVDPLTYPFLGEHATWVAFKPDATIEFARTGRPAPGVDVPPEVRVRTPVRALIAEGQGQRSWWFFCSGWWCQPDGPPDGPDIFIP